MFEILSLYSFKFNEYIMKQFLLSAALAIMAFSGSAQTFDEWRNPRVNEVNRAPMHSSYLPTNLLNGQKSLPSPILLII